MFLKIHRGFGFPIVSAIDHAWNPCAFPDAEPVPGKRVMMMMILDYKLHCVVSSHALPALILAQISRNQSSKRRQLAWLGSG